MKIEKIKILNDFVERVQSTVMPVSLSFKIYELNKELEEVIKKYTDVLNKIVDECLVKDENNKIKMVEGKVEVIDGKLETWNEKTNELENTDFTIRTRIDIKQLGDLMVSPLELSALVEIRE